MKTLTKILLVISLPYFTGCKKADESSLKTQETLQSQPQVAALGVWTKKAPKPELSGTYGGVHFTINGMVYMGFGGVEAHLDNTFWQYNPTTDTWTQKAGKGGLGFSDMASFSANNKGYSVTGGLGNESDHYSDEVFEYDPLTNVWTQKANFPGGPRQFAKGFNVGSKGYLSGGIFYDRTEQVLTRYNDLWEYNPASDCWTKKVDSLGFWWQGSFSLGRFIYFIPDEESHVFLQYNPASNKFIKKANFPGVVRSWGLGLAIGEKGYYGLGNIHDISGVRYLNDFWEYNPSADQWLRMPDFPGGTTSMPEAVGANDKGYIKTGRYQNPRDVQTDFWEFNPSVSN
ncbi:MAG: type sorting protein [Sphingobacteriales bacterium]|nr:type sorting protein [Sphingobacteriales bacterium]